MVVRREGGKFVLRSKKTGRVLGRSRSKKGIKKRERQVQFFKNLSKSSGGRGSLRAKVRKKSLIGTRSGRRRRSSRGRRR